MTSDWGKSLTRNWITTSVHAKGLHLVVSM